MQTVQLYINNQRVDLFDDETISLNSSIKNVRDIAKVFTDFSKSFTVPASSTNNKIFRHYYNYSIDNGFDARKKETAKIELNSREFKDGKIKLEGVNLKNGKPESYKLVFFGNTVNLKDALGEDNLSSLDWLNNLTLNYDAATVQTALKTGITSTIDGVDYKVVAPLVSHTTRLYYDTNQEGTGNLNPSGTTMQGVPYTELKYGIPIKAIIKAIEEADYGIQFSTDFFNETNLAYNNLYMWMHRKKGNAFETSEVTHQITSFEQNLSEMVEVSCYPDRLLVFNASQGVSYTLRVESNSSDPYTVIIKKDGQVFRTVTATNGLILETSGVLTNSSTGYSVFIQTDSIITEITAEWQITSIQYPESFTYTFGANPAESIGTTQSFIITEQMPEMKVIDFITGLFKMFNLTAYEENGVIQVKTLDDYYDSSEVLTEITQYVDIESHTVDAALPFKEIKLEYEGLNTKLAKKHEQISNQGWGTGEYEGGDKFDASESIYKVSVPFEHMKYERLFDYDNTTLEDVQVGWFVDDNDAPYFGKPLLFYPILIETGTQIRFLNDSTYDDITNYYIPSNSVLIDYTISPDNIHFNLELNEYTFSEDYTGTLFENYYKTYITDVFNSKLRISKYKAYFDLKFLLKYKLSDKVQILDRIYKINNINTNLQTGESELELLNIANVSYESGDTSRLPAVTTQPQTIIDYSSAIFNGTITDKGSPVYTQRGFYWKVGTGDPTASDNTISIDFSTTDEFSFNKTDLAGSTTYSYRAFAINTKGPAYGGTIRFTTAEAPAVPQLTTLDATNRTETSFTMNANIFNEGFPPYTEGNRGFYWKQYDGTAPTASDNVVVVTGTGTGTFSHNLTGLNDDTTYSYVAFCENSESVTPSLGGVKQVTTSAFYKPVVATENETLKTETSFTMNGNVLDSGNPSYSNGNKGFYWKQGTGTPTAADNVVVVDGTGTGSYSDNLTGLNDGTTYSYIAFCSNSEGIALGVTRQVTTSAFYQPILTTIDATLRTETSFTMNANISNSGNPPYTDGSKGFYWSENNTTPTAADNVVIVSGIGTGDYSSNLTGLNDNTTYYYVAFCSNTEGTSTGLPKQAKTIAYRVPIVTTDNETNKTETSFTMNATITDAGNPAYSDGDKGFYWKVGTGTPTASDNVQIISGTGTGSYDFNLTGLTDGQTYSYMAFCSNTEGIALGGVKEVTTSSFFLPAVTTDEATIVTTSSARLNATVTDVGNPAYTQKGFWYIIGDQDPTGNNTTYVSGTGTGPYFLDISGLDENQFYSFKAFVINSEGTAEGVKQILRTTENQFAPTVSTSTPIFNQNSATFYGNVESVGNPNYTTKGFYWKVGSGDPTASDNVVTVSGTSAGSYNSDLITGLSSNTLHSVRSFCTNSVDTAVGVTRTFTTSQYTTTINLPSVDVITNAVGSVYANTGAGFPASANGTTTDTLCIPIGDEGDAFEYDVDYIANADAEFTSIDNITNLQSTNPAVTVTKVGFTASVFTLRFSGTIGNLSTVANLSWSGAAESNTPTVDTLDPTLVTYNSARMNGDITDVGNPNYTSKGFYWAEGSVIPSDQDNVVTVTGTSAGTYFADLTGLTELSTYSYLAWAVGPASPNPSLGFPKEVTTLRQDYIPSVETNTPIPLTPTSARLQGVITDEGQPTYTERGFYYAVAPTDPTGLNKTVVSGTDNPFSIDVTGLSETTTYNVRAFVTNSVGTSEGDIQPFTTGETTFAPTALTSAATSLTINSATLNGQITNAGNPAYTNNNRGFYYILGTGDPAIGGTRVDVSGTDTNPYSYVLSGLLDNTDYSFKAFASNGISPDPSFGQKQTFRTIEEVYPAEVTTVDAQDVLETSVKLIGNITNEGKPAYTAKGFCWVEGFGTPTILDNPTTLGYTGAGLYEATVTIPEEASTFTARAFVTNSQGTSYGDDYQFSKGYYTLTKCYDGTTGHSSVQPIDTFNPQLGTLTRVVDSLGDSYTVSGSNSIKGTITISDTGFDGCPTDLPRTYNIQECDGIVTSTINYESESQLLQGSTYWDGTQCWTILALAEYDENATDITGTTIYNTCSACTTANQYAPSVSTLAETDLTHEEVRLNGNLVDNGYPNITEKGFVWIQASTGDPTTANNKIIVSGATEGTYDFLLQSLTPERDYRYAAYATNSVDTIYGATEPFTTDVAPVVCEGGTLYFNSSVITGINATLQTGNLSYGTGECGYLIPTLSLLFTNNEGEWESTTQITSIQLFEGGVDVSSQYVLGKVLNGDVMTITLDGNFPDAFNDGDHFYEFRITAFNIPQFTTTITLPPSNAVDHASVSVTKNGTTQFPASRRDTLFTNSTLYPSGFDGDAYEYTITYTADAGYEFTGLGNITLAGTTGAGVNQIQDAYNSTTYTIKVYGTIQATDITGTANWSGTAIADPATSYTKEYRFLGQTAWEAWPAAGVDIGSGATPVEVKITPDGSWSSIQGANYSYLISSHSPTYDYSGDEVIMTVYFNNMGGADPDGSSSITITPRASVTSLGGLRFNYFQPI